MKKEYLIKQSFDFLKEQGNFLDVVTYPNPILKKISEPIKAIDNEVLQLIRNMFATMYKKGGVGLAAIQVANPLRVFVADCGDKKEDINGMGYIKINEPMVFINPIIIKKSNIENKKEGCLSVPLIVQEVPRANVVHVKALDLNGKEFILKATDLLAQCIQHEIEHLNGEIFMEKYQKLKS